MLMSGLAGWEVGTDNGKGLGQQREGQRARLRGEVLTMHISFMFVLDEGIASGLP